MVKFITIVFIDEMCVGSMGSSFAGSSTSL